MTKTTKTKIEKTYNMFATGKKFKISGIAKKLNSSEGSVRKMISNLNAKGYNIDLVAEGTYQMSK
jgi:Mn-dependent DtxR family transcriptional regulator